MSMASLVKETKSPECPKTEKIDGFDKYKVESAADTLQRAMEIRQDKKLLTAALKVLKVKEESAKKARNWADNLK